MTLQAFLTALVVMYVLSNLAAAIVLGCMLQSKFVASTMYFRIGVGVLCAMSLGCFFYGLDLLRESRVDELGLAQALQAFALAVMLVLMRLRQVSADEHLHPRQRTQSRPRGGGVSGVFDMRLLP